MVEPNWDRTPWNAPPGELSTDRFYDEDEDDFEDELDDEDEFDDDDDEDYYEDEDEL